MDNSKNYLQQSTKLKNQNDTDFLYDSKKIKNGRCKTQGLNNFKPLYNSNNVKCDLRNDEISRKSSFSTDFHGKYYKILKIIKK